MLRPLDYADTDDDEEVVAVEQHNAGQPAVKILPKPVHLKSGGRVKSAVWERVTIIEIPTVGAKGGSVTSIVACNTCSEDKLLYIDTILTCNFYLTNHLIIHTHFLLIIKAVYRPT